MIRLAIAAALLVATGSGCQSQGTAATAPSGLAVVPLTIETQAGRKHAFKVEVAATPDQQARGLMFRKALPAGTGMIFPMKPPRPASFWMKNTLIPLDMIFVRADGSIAMIAAETVPHSLTPVGTAEPVAAVLEIAGGEAARLGIAEDDRVIWQAP